MRSTARKSAATKELLRQVAAKATGRMTLPSLEGSLEAYLHSGNIIGVVVVDDDQRLLRRVRIAGALSEARLLQLEKVSRGGQSIFGQLLDEVESTMIEALLEERFRDNLIAFVSSSEKPTFTAMAGVFIDNMQMGKNTAQIIDASCKEADLANRHALETLVVLGSGEASDDADRALVAAASSEPRSILALIERAAVEPWLGRARTAGLIEKGALAEDDLLEIGTDELELLGDDDQTEDASLPPPDPKPVETTNILAAADTHYDEEDEEEVPGAAEVTEDVVEPPVKAAGKGLEPITDVSPEELSKWLDNGSGLSEEDLAFFEDHENDRGAGQGGFSTESHNLEKVEVGGGASQILEADEAPTSKFSAPVLSERDATEKIEVCNDVLRQVSAAFDGVEGTGRGRAAIQLLVDGAPSKFTALLHDITVSSDGELPPEDLLDNLGGRPPSEHRQLINSALKNVIERALSSAADDLPEETFDDVYESVAGYNQRLGL